MNGKRYKRKGTRRIRRRRVSRRTRRRTVNVNRALQPVAQRAIVRMKYCQSIIMPTSTSTPVKQLFNLNSIYDPDRTGVGHQPYGHDQFQVLYNRYRVISCSWVITAQTTAAEVLTVAALPTNEITTLLNMETVKESPRCKWITQNIGADTRPLKGRLSLPSLVGRTKQQYMADDRYQSQFGASPVELAVLEVYLANNANGNLGGRIDITLTYLVECFDLNPLGSS